MLECDRDENGEEGVVVDGQYSQNDVNLFESEPCECEQEERDRVTDEANACYSQYVIGLKRAQNLTEIFQHLEKKNADEF